MIQLQFSLLPAEPSAECKRGSLHSARWPRKMDADTLARLSRLLRGRPEDVDNLTQQELVLIAFGTGGNAATIARAEELNEDTENIYLVSLFLERSLL